MNTAKNRVFRDDENGISRLAAAPGADPAPKAGVVGPGPAAVTMAPQEWDDVKGEFKPDPEPEDDSA